MKKPLELILFLSSVFLIFAPSVFAQDNPQTRSITSDDFASQRPAASSAGLTGKNDKKGNKTTAISPKSKKAVYKYVRQDKSISRAKNVQRKHFYEL